MEESPNPLDLDTVLTVVDEINADPNRPKIKALNPLDPVEVEIALLEIDNMTEEYFEQFRERFHSLMVFNVLRDAYRVKFRTHIINMVKWARDYAEKQGANPEDWLGPKPLE